MTNEKAFGTLKVPKTLHIQNRESKPGEYYITRQTQDIVRDIKRRNSVNGHIRIITEEQREKVMRELTVEKTKAAIEERQADVAFIESQYTKISKVKLHTPRTKKI